MLFSPKFRACYGASHPPGRAVSHPFAQYAGQERLRAYSRRGRTHGIWGGLYRFAGLRAGENHVNQREVALHILTQIVIAARLIAAAFIAVILGLMLVIAIPIAVAVLLIMQLIDLVLPQDNGEHRG